MITFSHTSQGDNVATLRFRVPTPFTLRARLTMRFAAWILHRGLGKLEDAPPDSPNSPDAGSAGMPTQLIMQPAQVVQTVDYAPALREVYKAIVPIADVASLHPMTKIPGSAYWSILYNGYGALTMIEAIISDMEQR